MPRLPLAVDADVVGLADGAGTDEAPDLLHAVGVAEDEGDHADEAAGARLAGHLGGEGGREGHRLLAEDVLAGAQGRHRVGVVVVVRRRHRHGVDVVAGEEGVEVVGGLRHAGARGHGLGAFEVAAEEGDDLTVGVSVHAGDMGHLGEGGGAQHGHPDRFSHRHLPCLPRCGRRDDSAVPTSSWNGDAKDAKPTRG